MVQASEHDSLVDLKNSAGAAGAAAGLSDALARRSCARATCSAAMAWCQPHCCPGIPMRARRKGRKHGLLGPLATGRHLLRLVLPHRVGQVD